MIVYVYLGNEEMQEWNEQRASYARMEGIAGEATDLGEEGWVGREVGR